MKAIRTTLSRQLAAERKLRREIERDNAQARGKIVWLSHLLMSASEMLDAKGAPELARLCRIEAGNARGGPHGSQAGGEVPF